MQQLKEIKRLYRLYMNGVVSHSMRSKGVDYRVNFGLTMPLLRRIAEQIEPSVAIAEELWQDRGVRESMLLAPMVFPVSECTHSVAQRWGEEMPNTEVADFCCKFLFSQLPYAVELVEEWVKTESDMIVYTGFRLAYSLLESVDNTEWVRSVAERAVVVAYQGHSVAVAAARRYLTEALLCERAGAVVVQVLQQASGVDAEWRDNLIALYDAR